MRVLNRLCKIALAASLLGTPALAREPGTPAAMPSGASAGVPVGANPPPGLYFSLRTELFSGDVYDTTGTKLPLSFQLKGVGSQLHWIPGTEILGGTYRAMLAVPFIDVKVAGMSNSGLGDITVSPLNLSWMLSPGVFVQSGISFGLPTGEYLGLGQANLSHNVMTTGVDLGFSYLKDGWNASVHINYFDYGTNDDNGFESGDEVLINWTAMKAIEGDQSIGLVGYHRQQIQDDTLGGAVFAGGNRARGTAIGVGYSKRFGPTELNVNLMHEFSSRNDAGGSKLQVNFFTPIKF